MRIFKNKKEKGFSLVEILIAIALNLLVAGMIITIASSSLRHIRTVKNYRNLYSTTSFLTAQLSYWIKQGTAVTVLNPITLEIQLPDSSIKTITRDGDNRITVDGSEYLTADNIEVDNLVFTEMDHSVRIAFTLETEGANETFSATTTVAQRNVF